MRQQTGWWLAASDRDMVSAEALLREGVYEGVAFHCQQSAEKALKAALVEHRLMARSHSCVEICQSLAEQEIRVPSAVLEASRRLDLHYTASRYPNGVGGAPQDFYDRPLAEECVRWANCIRQFAKSSLP